MRYRGFRAAGPALLLALLAAVPQARGQGLEFIRSHYEKHEYRIPMRDGKRLFTAVFTPRDRSRSYPILMLRTSYGIGPYGAAAYKATLGPSQEFACEGFIFVYQDVRGSGKSEGEFVHVRPHIARKHLPGDVDESSDTYDTIGWLLRNVPDHNGRAGLWGTSYPGYYAAAGMIDAHPALKAVSPQAPVGDWFIGDDFHRHGALILPNSVNFCWKWGGAVPATAPIAYPTNDGYRFFLDLGTLARAEERFFHNSNTLWNALMEHQTYDEFWKARSLFPYMKHIKPAVLVVGGWFDSEDLYGALHTYEAVGGARKTLVMGPWVHGGWNRAGGASLGTVRFGSNTADYFRAKILFPFFMAYLKGEGDRNPPGARVFETGANEWKTFPGWPPKGARKQALYFHAGGALSFARAAGNGKGYDEYVSDPANPVPYLDRKAIRAPSDFMVADQRFAASRPDVLVYRTPPLEHDVTLAGPVTPALYVSTSGTDSDWVVKLIDVYPDGFQQLLRAEPFRGRFRKSYAHPEPFQPGKPAQVQFTMPDVFHCFRKGHRIMVQVQSTWFPLVDRNPQKLVDIYRATPTDFQPATQRLYHTGSRPSCVKVRVI